MPSRTTDPALAALVAALRSNPLDFGADPAAARAQFEATLATIPVAPDLACEPASLGGVPSLIIRPPVTGNDSALLYLHGGAYVAGSASGYRALAGELARAAGTTGHALDYRLAPEAPFPAAIHDVAAAYAALVAQGLDPKRIAFAGDSAGGGVTVAALVHIRDAGLPLPAAAVLISPWADLRGSAPSQTHNAARDPSLTPQGLAKAAANYLGSAAPDHPLASPVLADLTGLPPLLIHVGSVEILLDDALALAAAAARADVPIRLEVWPHMVHVWHAFGFMLAPGHHAVQSAGAFIAAAFTGDSA